MSDYSDSDGSDSIKDAASTLGVLLGTSAFSDLTLTCHGREIKVHKNILYARSEYFRKMLLGPFKESSASVIDFSEDDPDDLYDFIHYLYHLDFRDKEDHGIEELMFYFRMYVIADKYDVASMRKPSLEIWEEGGAFDELLYSDDEDEPDADRTRDLDRIVGLLREIDALTHNDALWELVMPVMEKHIATLLSNKAFKKLL